MNASPLTELTEKEFVKRIGMIVVIIILMLTIYMSLGIWLFNDSKIFPNVFINDINVGGLIPSEAKLRADERLKKQLDEFVIQLAYGDSMWDLDYKDIDLYYLLDNSIENAYRVGRNKGYIHGLKTVFSLRKKPRVIKLEPSYNLTKIVDKIDKISKTIDSPSINAKIIRENEHFIITKEVLGISVDKETLKYSIINAIDSSDVVSIDMDVEDVEPEITENDLKDIGDLIGESVTRFNNYNKSRTENIKIAANVINGTILMPGDEFSFNDSTGPRSAEAGYKEASVIVDGEFTTGIGGGVCQVSTTLYQTALKSDMEITSRRNHGLPVGYVPMGQDATIAYGY
ncbi:MAG TPA: VanW family protein, partial [Oscillospiraceae bacterium]|nr:VanW family protein [Oscillospiraceae bacterium]